ncbi:MAG TPA: rhomboid family intramembrane serine protease [Myxococcota bacterium]|nr:rhomboid family intramembrane serine protease [Myxococcota bacterium]
MYGRGYQPGFGIGPPITPPIVKQILIANAAVFVLQQIFPMLTAVASVVPIGFWQAGFLWEPFTYMWLHASFGHIAMNMFMLWMFGSQLALAWGPKRFLRYYLICGVGAGLIIATYPYLVMAVHPELLQSQTLGASGAIYGVLLAYSLTWPDRTIMLIFPPVAFRAIWLIPGLFLMSMMFPSGQNISHIGHLGGVIVGWLYLRRSGGAGALFSFSQLRSRWKRHQMRRKLRALHYEEFEARRREREDEDRRFH